VPEPVVGDPRGDTSADPAAARADPPGTGERSGVDLARAALAAARMRARAADAQRKQRRGAASAREQRRAGARPDDRDPQRLGSAIGRLVTERGWETPAAVGGVVGRWAQLVGPAISEHCVPEHFEDGELVVRADSPAWATELRLLSGALLARLNAALSGPDGGARRGDGGSGGVITRIRVLGPGSGGGRQDR
jgi:predicted nucleic acid-binding Zn ribbon protein